MEVNGHLGTRLAIHRLGSGRPLLLLHGLFSSAQVNWIKYGTAAQLAEAGFEAIMPDLRAHGASEAPHDPAAAMTAKGHPPSRPPLHPILENIRLGAAG